ncbi:MAG: DUF3772 domain-containing protein [Aquisalinus sp.]|nr:DUF3772 domain-containing protein [Aquisalinus sp.]
MTRFILALCAIIAGLHSVCFAQSNLDAIRAGIDQRSQELRIISAQVRTEGADLVTLRSQTRDLQREAETRTAPLRDQVAEIRADLQRLGDPPAEGLPPELPDIAAERLRLSEALAFYDGYLRQSDLNIAEAERLVEEISALREALFYQQLFARDASPLLPASWQEYWDATVEGSETVWRSFADWKSQLRADGRIGPALISLTLSVVLALALFLPIRRRLDREVTKRIAKAEPLPSRRVLVAAARASARVIPGLIGLYIIREALRLNGVPDADSEDLFNIIWFSIAALLLVDGAIVAAFSFGQPQWRVLPVKASSGPQLRFALIAAVVMLGIDRVLAKVAIDFSNEAAALTSLHSMSTAILAGLLLFLCRRTLWEVDPSRQTQSDSTPHSEMKAIRRTRHIGRFVAFTAILAVILGYITLGHFLTTRLFGLAALVTVIWVLRAFLREGIRLFDRKFSSISKPENEQENLLYFWLSLSIDVVALLAFIPPAFILLGADWLDVRDGVADAFFGFDIGSVRISVANILTAIALFVGVMYVTRLFQKAAETRIFPQSRIDIGVQNSLRTLMGYIGLIIAFTIGVSTLGFDLSNLAIIAGALSVGIGFGLQSIVNNFVSGLILLFERPIKVGDWIVTSSGEGYVKRISVRSTEIETFDRSSVIVPNSELISSAVTNWTHKDKIGRVIVPVGVSYNADPEQVLQILADVAREDPLILDYPAPLLTFNDFGDSSLNFELRGFINDINSSLSTRTRLRVAIFKKLKEANIEIPFPQRDLHIRSNVDHSNVQETNNQSTT